MNLSKSCRIIVTLVGIWTCGPARAGDVGVYLDSSDGSTAFKVFDVDSNEMVRVQSDGVLNMGAHWVTNGVFGGDGRGLTNVTAKYIFEIDPVWRAQSNGLQTQINGKTDALTFEAATNDLRQNLGFETTYREYHDGVLSNVCLDETAARVGADAALSNAVATRLESNTWAAADSSTNYVRRTGDTISGSLTNAGSLTVNSTNVSIGAGSASDDDYLFFDAGTKYLMWDNSATGFAFSENVGFGGAISVGSTVPTNTMGYSRFSTVATTDHALASASDVLIGGDLEVNGNIYFDGNMIYMGGTTTNDDESIWWDDNSGLVKTYWDDSEECFKVDGSGVAIEGPIYVGYIVNGTTNYNVFSTAKASPTSGAMNTAADVYIGGDLEVNQYAYFGNRVYMGAIEADQNLYFYEDGSFSGEYIRWQDSSDQFVISDDVDITGTLSKGGGSFKIDHPLDPGNKFLYHSFVESPDMKNIYDGVAVLDERGEAVVEMPAWFSALNRDFRYQLTAVGAPAPGLYVAQEVTDNRFKIAGGAPGLKVSWQVTGIRQDAFANAHRIPVEEDKPADQRGTFLYPEAAP